LINQFYKYFTSESAGKPMNLNRHLQIVTVVVAGIFPLVPVPGFAGDVVNGWSDATTITEMRNHSGVIDVRLNSLTAGCGTPGDSASYWRVVVDSSESSRHRRASLLAAYVSGKRVQLRCENSIVTDFVVLD
jgi:hypothetical protein